MSPMKRTSNFKEEWLHNERFKIWLSRHKSSSCVNYAHCKICTSDIHLGSIGIGALESHRKGKKHIERAARFTLTKSTTLQSWVGRSSTSQGGTTATTETAETQDKLPVSTPTTHLETAISTSSGISSFVSSESLLKAEIRWALHTVIGHNSYRSNDGISELFKEMFTDSEIAKQFTCGKTKSSYLISFGLAPYYSNELKDLLHSSSSPLVLLFDESFNRVTKNEQMDIQVRFWDDSKQQAITRYLNSEFLGHCRARDLLQKLKQSTENLDATKVLQISMDGPNVNHKFYKDYVEDRQLHNPQAPSLVNIGSCGLHVIHGAFKTGANATGWDVGHLLRSLWFLFNESPARRADFTAITGSVTFPLQFCSTRWVEDVLVAERAVAIWSDICKYITKVSSGSKSTIPKCASYTKVVKGVNDPLTLAKLHVFIDTAKCLKPFLESFQSDEPMCPFLAQELYQLLLDILEKFIQQSALEKLSPSTIVNLDYENQKIQRDPRKVHIGFAAKEVLKKISGVSEVNLVEFKSQCLLFYKSIVSKVLERSPLKFSFVRSLACLDPRIIAEIKHSSTFETLLSKMTDNNWLKTSECDQLIKQYKTFTSLAQLEHLDEFKVYNHQKSLRLDTFYYNIFKDKHELVELWEFIKSMLVLSHGQASVERGFSINKDVLTCNMMQKTIVAHRTIVDAVKAELGSEYSNCTSKVAITKKLVSSCQAARMRYSNYLEDLKIEQAKTEAGKRKMYLHEQISNSKEKRLKLESAVQRLTHEADELALESEKSSNFTMLSKSNCLRTKARALEENMHKEAENVKEFQEKLKKCAC